MKTRFLKFRFLPVILIVSLIASFLYSQVQISGGSNTASYTVTNLPDGVWLEESGGTLTIKSGGAYLLLGTGAGGAKAWLRADSAHIAYEAIRSYHIEDGTILGEDLSDGIITGIKIASSVADSLVESSLGTQATGGKIGAKVRTGGGLDIESGGIGIADEGVKGSNLASTVADSLEDQDLGILATGGKLGVKVRTGGSLNIASGGLGVEVDGTSIAVGGSGLTVASIDSNDIDAGGLAWSDLSSSIKDTINHTQAEYLYPPYGNSYSNYKKLPASYEFTVSDTMEFGGSRWGTYRRVADTSATENMQVYHIYIMWSPANSFSTWEWSSVSQNIITLQYRSDAETTDSTYAQINLYNSAGANLYSTSAHNPSTAATWSTFSVTIDKYSAYWNPLIIDIEVGVNYSKYLDLGYLLIRYKGR